MKTKRPIIIGITGSIGMGKSTCAKMLAAKGLTIVCADKIVHDLMLPDGKATKKIARLFPAAIDKKGVNRKKLLGVLTDDPKAFDLIEALIHPLVFDECAKHIRAARKQKSDGLILDIPLLFEAHFDVLCDVTICVSASKKAQKERVLARRGMTPARFKALLSRQMPDAEKRKRATFVVRTDKPLKETRADMNAIWEKISGNAA